ncbi:hypothetical protein EV216_11140 [Rhodovulum steppense]|uniref:Uncharacterized protein n=1 Tax=Rhodovulum steppense TaxID=540251 RepID=A0A4R1YU03_9RHOB|nr:hypothetical protein EV216_11140 [Rhodovulum steppense]
MENGGLGGSDRNLIGLLLNNRCWELVRLSSPTQSVMDVLTGERAGDLDLDAVACLCVPLWAIPANQRATVTALCEHP